MGEEATAQAETQETEIVEDITSLANVFDTEQKVLEKVETESKTEETQEEETEAETTTAEAETTQEPEEKMVPVAALLDERRKRQELEKKLEAETVIPDPIEDPEGYANHIKGESGKSELDLRINLTREFMLDSKEDYAEKEAVFLGLVGELEDGVLVSVKDQSLLDKFRQSRNPAKFAYETAIQHLKVQELSDPKYEESLRAKIKAELLAELKPDGKLKATEVPDLTTATAKGNNSEEVEVPKSVENVFD